MIYIAFIVIILLVLVYAVSMKISTMAMIYYMQIKKYKLPNDEEMKECTSYVAKHIVEDMLHKT